WRGPELGSPARGSHRRGHRTGGDPPGAPRTRRGVAASCLWRELCLVVFFGMLGLQFWTLHRLLVVGYKSQPVVGPESPSVLANYVAERDEAEAYRLTGAYYAKACDRFHELSELLGERVARATVTFQWTLVALLLGVALVAGGALWPLMALDRRASNGRRSCFHSGRFRQRGARSGASSRGARPSGTADT